MAQQDDSTPLHGRSFNSNSFNCSGHYHLAESINVGKTGAILPLCNGTHFEGSVKGAGHRLHITDSQPLFDTLENADINVALSYSLQATPTDRERPTGLLANRLSGNNTINLPNSYIGPSNAVRDGKAATTDVSVVGLIEDGQHHLKQSATGQAVTYIGTMKSGVRGGAVGHITGGKITITQERCHLVNYNTHAIPLNNSLVVIGGGVAELTGGQLILTQTDSSIGENGGSVSINPVLGGGIGKVSGRGTVILTQTDFHMYRSNHGPTNNSATFGALEKNGTVTLRLFSGYSYGHVCGTIESNPAVTVKGVVDTVSYAANAISCKVGNHTHADLKLLDTTKVQDWIEAHSEFCCSKVEGIPSISCLSDNHTSCHYPYEQQLVTVPMGNDWALLLSRQHYRYNRQRDKEGLLRVSRLLLNHANSGSSAELDRSFGGDGTLLFGPGGYHQQLQPGRVLLAQANDHNLTLLCTDNSDRNVYHVGTLPLRNKQTDNATVVMQRLDQLQGRPVLLTLDQNGQDGHLFTHEQHSHTVYRYCLNGSCERPVGSFSTQGPVIGVGTHNQAMYVASCNQTNDVILQRVDPDTWEPSEPIAATSLTSPVSPDDTLAINEDTLQLIPQRTILIQEDSDQLQTLRVSLPWRGGVAHWHVSRAAGQQLNKKTCEQASAPENKPTKPEDEFSRYPLGEVLGIPAAAAGGAAVAASLVATVLGIACYHKRHGHQKHAGKKVASAAAETPATDDTEATMDRQRKSDAGLPMRSGTVVVQELAP